MTRIYFPFRAGFISAFYFIILDVIGLSLYDIIFAKLSSSYYVQGLIKGDPIRARSTDVPGITTSLLDGYFKPINITIFTLKLFLIVSVFLFELPIESWQDEAVSTYRLTATSYFNSTGARWDKVNWDEYLRVVHPFVSVRKCHDYYENNNTIVFYNVAFNITGDRIVNNSRDKTLPYIPFRKETLRCLSPDVVKEESAIRSIRVVGCSQVYPTTCFNESSVSVPFNSDSLAQMDAKSITYKSTYVYTLYFDSGIVFRNLRKEYENAKTRCVESEYGIREKGYNTTKIFRCLIEVPIGSNTLLELWNYNFDLKKFTRPFPGPVFEGKLDIAGSRTVYLLVKFAGLNWLSFSSAFVAFCSSYQPANLEVKERGEKIQKSSTTLLSFIGVFFFVVIAAVGRNIVKITIDKSKPQINTIDGISSILKEQKERNGNGLKTGAHLMIGFSKVDTETIHFGPIGKYDVCTKKLPGFNIR